MLTRAASALGLVLVAGCATNYASQDLPEDHPANPAAAEAGPVPPSNTLALGATDSAGRPAGEDAARETGGQASPTADQPMPQHHAAPVSPHAGHGGHGGGATTPATTQPAYVCPMHPGVVSSNPKDRCPKCNMKINKPAKAALGAKQPPTQAAPAGRGGHEHHGGHQ